MRHGTADTVRSALQTLARALLELRPRQALGETQQAAHLRSACLGADHHVSISTAWQHQVQVAPAASSTDLSSGPNAARAGAPRALLQSSSTERQASTAHPHWPQPQRYSTRASGPGSAPTPATHSIDSAVSANTRTGASGRTEALVQRRQGHTQPLADADSWEDEWVSGLVASAVKASAAGARRAAGRPPARDGPAEPAESAQQPAVWDTAGSSAQPAPLTGEAQRPPQLSPPRAPAAVVAPQPSADSSADASASAKPAVAARPRKATPPPPTPNTQELIQALDHSTSSAVLDRLLGCEPVVADGTNRVPLSDIQPVDLLPSKSRLIKQTNDMSHSLQHSPEATTPAAAVSLLQQLAQAGVSHPTLATHTVTHWLQYSKAAADAQEQADVAPGVTAPAEAVLRAALPHMPVQQGALLPVIEQVVTELSKAQHATDRQQTTPHAADTPPDPPPDTAQMAGARRVALSALARLLDNTSVAKLHPDFLRVVTQLLTTVNHPHLITLSAPAELCDVAQLAAATAAAQAGGAAGVGPAHVALAEAAVSALSARVDTLAPDDVLRVAACTGSLLSHPAVQSAAVPLGAAELHIRALQSLVRADMQVSGEPGSDCNHSASQLLLRLLSSPQAAANAEAAAGGVADAAGVVRGRLAALLAPRLSQLPAGITLALIKHLTAASMISHEDLHRALQSVAYQAPLLPDRTLVQAAVIALGDSASASHTPGSANWPHAGLLHALEARALASDAFKSQDRTQLLNIALHLYRWGLQANMPHFTTRLVCRTISMNSRGMLHAAYGSTGVHVNVAWLHWLHTVPTKGAGLSLPVSEAMDKLESITKDWLTRQTDTFVPSHSKAEALIDTRLSDAALRHIHKRRSSELSAAAAAHGLPQARQLKPAQAAEQAPSSWVPPPAATLAAQSATGSCAPAPAVGYGPPAGESAPAARGLVSSDTAAAAALAALARAVGKPAPAQPLSSKPVAEVRQRPREPNVYAADHASSTPPLPWWNTGLPDPAAAQTATAAAAAVAGTEQVGQQPRGDAAAAAAAFAHSAEARVAGQRLPAALDQVPASTLLAAAVSSQPEQPDAAVASAATAEQQTDVVAASQSNQTRAAVPCASAARVDKRFPMLTVSASAAEAIQALEQSTSPAVLDRLLDCEPVVYDWTRKVRLSRTQPVDLLPHKSSLVKQANDMCHSLQCSPAATTPAAAISLLQQLAQAGVSHPTLATRTATHWLQSSQAAASTQQQDASATAANVLQAILAHPPMRIPAQLIEQAMADAATAQPAAQASAQEHTYAPLCALAHMLESRVPTKVPQGDTQVVVRVLENALPHQDVTSIEARLSGLPPAVVCGVLHGANVAAATAGDRDGYAQLAVAAVNALSKRLPGAGLADVLRIAASASAVLSVQGAAAGAAELYSNTLTCLAEAGHDSSGVSSTGLYDAFTLLLQLNKALAASAVSRAASAVDPGVACDARDRLMALLAPRLSELAPTAAMLVLEQLTSDTAASAELLYAAELSSTALHRALQSVAYQAPLLSDEHLVRSALLAFSDLATASHAPECVGWPHMALLREVDARAAAAGAAGTGSELLPFKRMAPQLVALAVCADTWGLLASLPHYTHYLVRCLRTEASSKLSKARYGATELSCSIAAGHWLLQLAASANPDLSRAALTAFDRLASATGKSIADMARTGQQGEGQGINVGLNWAALKHLCARRSMMQAGNAASRTPVAQAAPALVSAAAQPVLQSASCQLQQPGPRLLHSNADAAENVRQSEVSAAADVQSTEAPAPLLQLPSHGDEAANAAAEQQAQSEVAAPAGLTTAPPAAVLQLPLPKQAEPASTAGAQLHSAEQAAAAELQPGDAACTADARLQPAASSGTLAAQPAGAQVAPFQPAGKASSPAAAQLQPAGGQVAQQPNQQRATLFDAAWPAAEPPVRVTPASSPPYLPLHAPAIHLTAQQLVGAILQQCDPGTPAGLFAASSYSRQRRSAANSWPLQLRGMGVADTLLAGGGGCDYQPWWRAGYEVAVASYGARVHSSALLQQGNLRAAHTAADRRSAAAAVALPDTGNAPAHAAVADIGRAAAARPDAGSATAQAAADSPASSTKGAASSDAAQAASSSDVGGGEVGSPQRAAGDGVRQADASAGSAGAPKQPAAPMRTPDAGGGNAAQQVWLRRRTPMDLLNHASMMAKANTQLRKLQRGQMLADSPKAVLGAIGGDIGRLYTAGIAYPALTTAAVRYWLQCTEAGQWEEVNQANSNRAPQTLTMMRALLFHAPQPSDVTLPVILRVWHNRVGKLLQAEEPSIMSRGGDYYYCLRALASQLECAILNGSEPEGLEEVTITLLRPFLHFYDRAVLDQLTASALCGVMHGAAALAAGSGGGAGEQAAYARLRDDAARSLSGMVPTLGADEVLRVAASAATLAAQPPPAGAAGAAAAAAEQPAAPGGAVEELYTFTVRHFVDANQAFTDDMLEGSVLRDAYALIQHMSRQPAIGPAAALQKQLMPLVVLKLTKLPADTILSVLERSCVAAAQPTGHAEPAVAVGRVKLSADQFHRALQAVSYQAPGLSDTQLVRAVRLALSDAPTSPVRPEYEPADSRWPHAGLLDELQTRAAAVSAAGQRGSRSTDSQPFAAVQPSTLQEVAQLLREARIAREAPAFMRLAGLPAMEQAMPALQEEPLLAPPQLPASQAASAAAAAEPADCHGISASQDEASAAALAALAGSAGHKATAQPQKPVQAEKAERRQRKPPPKPAQSVDTPTNRPAAKAVEPAMSAQKSAATPQQAAPPPWWTVTADNTQPAATQPAAGRAAAPSQSQSQLQSESEHEMHTDNVSDTAQEVSPLPRVPALVAAPHLEDWADMVRKRSGFSVLVSYNERRAVAALAEDLRRLVADVGAMAGAVGSGQGEGGMQGQGRGRKIVKGRSKGSASVSLSASQASSSEDPESSALQALERSAWWQLYMSAADPETGNEKMLMLCLQAMEVVASSSGTQGASQPDGPTSSPTLPLWLYLRFLHVLNDSAAAWERLKNSAERGREGSRGQLAGNGYDNDLAVDNGAVQAASRGWRTPYTPISQYTAQPASGSTAPAQSVPASLLESAVPGPDVLLSTDLLSPKPMRGFLSLAYGRAFDAFERHLLAMDHSPLSIGEMVGVVVEYGHITHKARVDLWRVCLRRFENAATLQRLPVSTVTRMLESLNAAGVQAPGTLRDMLWLIPAEKLQASGQLADFLGQAIYMASRSVQSLSREDGQALTGRLKDLTEHLAPSDWETLLQRLSRDLQWAVSLPVLHAHMMTQLPDIFKQQGPHKLHRWLVDVLQGGEGTGDGLAVLNLNSKRVTAVSGGGLLEALVYAVHQELTNLDNEQLVQLNRALSVRAPAIAAAFVSRSDATSLTDNDSRSPTGFMEPAQLLPPLTALLKDRLYTLQPLQVVRLMADCLKLKQKTEEAFALQIRLRGGGPGTSSGASVSMGMGSVAASNSAATGAENNVRFGMGSVAATSTATSTASNFIDSVGSGNLGCGSISSDMPSSGIGRATSVRLVPELRDIGSAQLSEILRVRLQRLLPQCNLQQLVTVIEGLAVELSIGGAGEGRHYLLSGALHPELTQVAVQSAVAALDAHPARDLALEPAARLIRAFLALGVRDADVAHAVRKTVTDSLAAETRLTQPLQDASTDAMYTGRGEDACKHMELLCHVAWALGRMGCSDEMTLHLIADAVSEDLQHVKAEYDMSVESGAESFTAPA